MRAFQRGKAHTPSLLLILPPHRAAEPCPYHSPHLHLEAAWLSH